MNPRPRLRKLLPAKALVCLIAALCLAGLRPPTVRSDPSADVSLSYAFPVPFRPSQGDTSVTFRELPSAGTIKIYTVTGELVRKIDFTDPTSGEVDWDVTNSGGEPVGSDVYVYVVQSGDNKKVGKLVVIR